MRDPDDRPSEQELDPDQDPGRDRAGRVVHRIVSIFERAWRRGERPRIVDHLDGAGPDRAAALVELVHSDLEFRIKAGEPARLEGYLASFPELKGDRRALVELLATEWSIRSRSEPDPGIDEYRRRFPDLADAVVESRPPLSSGIGSVVPFDPFLCRTVAADEPEAKLPRPFMRYELREVVGQGEFGRVYRAWDPIRRAAVAVKLPRQGASASPSAVAIFLREARVLALQRHPGIVPIYDGGKHEGMAYLVSEFIEGQTLAAAIADGPLPVANAADLMATVLDAVHYAHEAGIIHRDLKPSNILLDSRFRPHLTDFGLARREGGDSSSINLFERTIVGTVAYMSPEQARGDPETVDRRSDVFSAGIVLYQLLTGELPFRGRGRMLVTQITDAEPMPPRSLNEAVPPALEAICLRALAKDPEGRYPTADAMARALHDYLEGKAPVAPSRRPLRLRLALRRAAGRPLRTLAAAYLLAAGLLWLPASTFLLIQAWAERAELRARLRPADDSPAKAPRPPDRGRPTGLADAERLPD